MKLTAHPHLVSRSGMTAATPALPSRALMVHLYLCYEGFVRWTNNKPYCNCFHRLHRYGRGGEGGFQHTSVKKKTYWNYTKPVLCNSLDLFHICPANYSYIAEDFINNDSLKSKLEDLKLLYKVLKEIISGHTSFWFVFNAT